MELVLFVKSSTSGFDLLDLLEATTRSLRFVGFLKSALLMSISSPPIADLGFMVIVRVSPTVAMASVINVCVDKDTRSSSDCSRVGGSVVPFLTESLRPLAEAA